MGSLLPLILLYALTVPPAWVLVGRVGFSPWWRLLLIIPFWGIVILVWFLAFRRWPNDTNISERFD